MNKKKKYEYHKQNDYPGERIAEKKRVADRKELADKKSDARIATKSRKDDALMNSEKKRSTQKAARINRKRNMTDNIGLAVIVGLVVILMAGSVWGFVKIQKQSSEINTQSNEIDSLNLKIKEDNGIVNDVNNKNKPIEVDITRPKILSVTPANNEFNISKYEVLEVKFNEPMDESTINSNTFILKQGRNLELDGKINYDKESFIMTFTPKNLKNRNSMQPSEQYGNIFTATITNNVKDIAGNSLLKNYKWRFTTSSFPFRR